MKTTVNFSAFCDAFHNMGRKDQFSYEGKRALFDHLEELESQLGEEHELDVIALCCDFREDTIADILKDYDLETIEELEDRTTVIYIDDLSNPKHFDIEVDGDKRIIIQQF